MLLFGNGLVDLVMGLKFSGNTSTKFDGKTPIILLSRHSLPVHHDPSPAFRHSIRSPSMKPKSRLDYRRVSNHPICPGKADAAQNGPDTHFSAPGIDGSDPAREPRRERRWCQSHIDGRSLRAI